jgi:hypothetical protein
MSIGSTGKSRSTINCSYAYFSLGFVAGLGVAKAITGLRMQSAGIAVTFGGIAPWISSIAYFATAGAEPPAVGIIAVCIAIPVIVRVIVAFFNQADAA